MKKKNIITYGPTQERRMLYVFSTGMVIMIFSAVVLFHQSISMSKDVMDEYTTLYEKIESMDDRISKLNESYNLNVDRIYKRILEIQEENPDEVRGAVIDKLKPENEDSVKFEASVLAILEIYDEFQSDIEIQTYLNDNASILDSIKRCESIQDKYSTFLDEYNYKYFSSAEEEK